MGDKPRVEHPGIYLGANTLSDADHRALAADLLDSRAQLAAVTEERDRLRFLIDGSTASCQRAADEIDRLRADLIESQRKYIVIAQAAAGLNHAIESTSAEQLARAVLGLRADLDASRQREAAAVARLSLLDGTHPKYEVRRIERRWWEVLSKHTGVGLPDDRSLESAEAAIEWLIGIDPAAIPAAPPPVDAATRGIVEAPVASALKVTADVLRGMTLRSYEGEGCHWFCQWCGEVTYSDDEDPPHSEDCPVGKALAQATTALSAYLAAHPSTDGGGQ